MKEGKGLLIWITGLPATGKTTIAKEVYKKIKERHSNTVHLDGDNMRDVWGIWAEKTPGGRRKMSMSYAKMCELLTNQGINVVMSTVALFHNVHEYNRKNNKKYYEILIETDDNILDFRHKKDASQNPEKNRWKEQSHEFPKNPDLILKNNTEKQLEENIKKILNLINL
ncbi:MAG: adenylyl-sulfate kinase [Candidatus Pacearchaeota archaeon]|nr:adenylyl-sulfate kinase [Candidatus Pacearchaeota archaeon]